MNKLMVPPRSLPGLLLVIAGLALAYFLSALLLISLSANPSGPVTTVWLPSGIAVAAMVIAGPLAAIGAFLGSVAIGLHSQAPLPLALILSIGNTAGELLCWWLLVRWLGHRLSGLEVTDGARLAAAAVVAGAVSATVSVTAYVQFGMIPQEYFFASWLSWLGSGASSIILVTPLLVFCMRRGARPWPPAGRRMEYAAALMLLVAAAFLWQGPHFQRGVDEPVILLLILGQLWIAFRFAPTLMTLSNFVVAVSAVIALVLRVGEAPPATAYPFILSLQLMLSGLALVGYLLAAMVARQRRSTRALQDAQGALVAGARDAGRAEIATNVLHNVGNVLNSVNVSAQLVVQRLQASKAHGLARVAHLLDAHQGDLVAYFTQDEKGKLVPGYLLQLTATLEQERQSLMQELELLRSNVDHIKDVVATQQRYAGVTTVLEPAKLQDLVEDALRLDRAALERERVTVVREFSEVPVAPLDKARIVQVLVNLISNARHAMAACGEMRRITLRVGQEAGNLFVRVADEGEGIPPDNLTRIFGHGFTTRRGGHGFGLHSSALASTEMGGTLTASSDGPGRGATFTLKLPLDAVPA